MRPAVGISGRAAFIGFDRIEIDTEGARVRMPAGIRVDLGGLGREFTKRDFARLVTKRPLGICQVQIHGASLPLPARISLP